MTLSSELFSEPEPWLIAALDQMWAKLSHSVDVMEAFENCSGITFNALARQLELDYELVAETVNRLLRDGRVVLEDGGTLRWHPNG